VPAQPTRTQLPESTKESRRQRQEYGNTDQAADQDKLRQRIGLQYLLRTEIKAKPTGNAKQQPRNRTADVVWFDDWIHEDSTEAINEYKLNMISRAFS
jgi:hypothetical protein